MQRQRIQIKNRYENYPDEENAYNMTSRAKQLIKRKKIHEAISLLKKGRRKFPEDRYFYSMLINCYNKKNEKNKAKEIFEKAKKLGVLNTKIYDSIIRTVPLGQIDHYLKDMGQQGIRRDKKLYCDILKRCKNFEDIDKYLNKMKQDVGTDNYAYNIIITKCNDLKTAEFYYNDLLEQNFKPNKFVLTNMIKKCDTQKQIDKYAKQLKRLDKVSILILMDKNPIDKAEFYFQKLKDIERDIDSQAYNILIKKTEHYESAEFYFNLMIKEGITPDKFSFMHMINKCENAKQVKKYIRKSKKYISPDYEVYSTIINKFYELQEFNKIRGVISSMPKRYRRLTKTKLYQSESLRKVKRYNESINIIEKLNTKMLSDENHIWAQSILAYSLKDMGHRKEALDILEKLEKEAKNTKSYIRIICGIIFTTFEMYKKLKEEKIMKYGTILLNKKPVNESQKRDINNALDILRKMERHSG